MQNESRAITITTQPPDAAPTIIPICDILELLKGDAATVAEEAETAIVPPEEDDAGAAEPESDASDWPLEALEAEEDVLDSGNAVDKIPAEGEAVNVLAALDVLVELGDGVDVSMEATTCEVVDTLSAVGVPGADDMAEVGEGSDDEPEALGGGAVVSSSESTWLQQWLSNSSHRLREATDSYVA
jgi:hypothetical protein